MISLRSSWTCLCNAASSTDAALFICRCKYAAASPDFYILRTTSRPRAMLETTVCSLWRGLFDIVTLCKSAAGRPRICTKFFAAARGPFDCLSARSWEMLQSCVHRLSNCDPVT